MADVIPFPEYAPDLSDLASKTSGLIQGCVPRGDGYGPFKSFQALTASLPDTCRGIYFSRRSDSSVAVFGATSTRIYLLSNTDFSWSDVSKGGVAYSSLPSTDIWQFEQFADTVVACQVNTVPQAFLLSSAPTFVDLGGSPPQAAFVAVIGGFLVLSGLLSASKRVQWSDLFGITTWTAGVGLSDFQDFPDGGSVYKVAGGDLYGVLFQDDRVRQMLYVPGSGAIFNFVVISRTHSIFGKYSVVTAGDRVFFCSTQGFQMIVSGGQLVPIGKERIDRTFFGDVDAGNLQLFLGSYDPSGTRVFWPYKSGAGLAGLFDKMLCFDWGMGRGGRWTVLPLSGEMIAAISKPGLTLENLDAIAPTPLNITGAANNGSGKIRLTLNALSNANFDIHGQNFINVFGVTGTTEANAAWAFSIIDATHIDLIGSTFVHAYVAGGHIGGSLDALPFSLDSISTASIAQLAIANSGHMVGFFSGPNIEAILETDEEGADGGDSLTFLSSVRPITDCPTVMVSIGFRNTAQAAVSYSTEQVLDPTIGEAGVCIEGRFLRARNRFPAAAVWTFANGVVPDAQLAGDS